LPYLACLGFVISSLLFAAEPPVKNDVGGGWVKDAVTTFNSKSIRKQRMAHELWVRSTTLEAYEKFGVKDPKWDEAARVGLRRYAEYAVRLPEMIAETETLTALDKAITLGCTAPLVRYAAAELWRQCDRNDKAAPLLREAARAF
jgi:hypothetical protein